MSIIQKLGEPAEEVVQSIESPENLKKRDINDSTMTEVDSFLKDIENKKSKNSIEYVREMRIFYQAPIPVVQPTTPNVTNNSNTLSSVLGSSIPSNKENSNHTLFFFICRRITSETDSAILIYIIVSEIMSVVRLGGTFDFIVDSSSFNTDAELPLWGYSKFWGRLKYLLGSICSTSLKKIYVLYPSIVIVMSVS